MKLLCIFTISICMFGAQIQAPAPGAQQVVLTLQSLPVTPPGTTGDIYVSFTPQGAAALTNLIGKKVKGIGLVSVSVCSEASQTVQGQVIKHIGRMSGISFIDGPAAAEIESRTAANSFAQILLDIGGDAPSVITALMASRIISSGGALGMIAAGASIGMTILKGRLIERVPDEAKLIASSIPTTISIPANGCASAPSGEYLALVRFDAKKSQSPINLKCAGWKCSYIEPNTK